MFQVGSFAGLPDSALLERFIGGPSSVAEAAFTVLVERHGEMVRRTCRQVTGDQFYAPAGYRVSARNKCRDPLNPYRLVGRVDRDVANLTILFEPGEQPPPSHALAAFKEAQTGPITGVPPARAD
jgi:hypothetical protein